MLAFQVTHIVLLFHYPFSSSIRSLSCCARAFGVEGVLGRLLAYSRYGKLESSVRLVRVCCFVCLVILFCVYLLIWMYDTVGLLLVVCLCVCCRWKQWRALINSPKRASLAQARLTEARLSLFPRMVAQATRSDFWASKQLAQARGISLKRDPALLMLLFLCPRLGGGVARLSETPQPERGAGWDSDVIGCLFISGWSLWLGMNIWWVICI